MGILTFCVALTAQGGVSATEPFRRELSISSLGSFWITNPLGPIDVTGSDVERIIVTGSKTIFAADRDALSEARDNCAVSFEGDDKVRLVRTLVRQMANARCVVAYSVQLPRSMDVKIGTRDGDVRVTNVNGSVTVNGWNNRVFFSGVTGASTIDVVNGYIQLEFARTPIANIQASTINGDINVYVPAGSNFEWVANTLVGDLLTSMAVRGSLTGNTFQGHFNAPGGPLLKTQSVAGRVRMLAVGTGPAQAHSVRVSRAEALSAPQRRFGMSTTKLQVPIVNGNFTFDDRNRFIDIAVGEVHGAAKIVTAAGQIEIGVVLADCDVFTKGGPISLGEVSGNLLAKTGAGDILVRAARVGGDIRTNGGIVRVLYTGGPTTLQSGGGDIVVAQAAGPVNAQTPSGDITLTVDPTMKTQKMEARTSKGNIVLNIAPNFAADVDAIVMTSDPDSNAIRSDFSSLQIRREQVNGRTRIHLTGKLNGGGEKVELFAENGDITINSQAQAPLSVITH